MTWARFRTELAAEADRDRLSDAEFRLYVEASLYVYATEDDSLRVPGHMLGRISGTELPEAAADGLVKAGWWRRAGEDWVIRHNASTFAQSFIATRDKRRRDRDAQARARQKRRRSDGEASAADSAADSDTDLTTYLPRTTRGDERGFHARENDSSCIADGCELPARRACSTCWDHAYLEVR